MRNLLTIDVEEYFQVEGFADVVDRAHWEDYESRVEPCVARLLDLLDAAAQKATFFALAWTAERHPEMVREIVLRGHEVASHGYLHRMIDSQGARAFRRDIRRSRAVLEGILGAPVVGYRAPSFSITPRTPWAHRVLAEEGFRYSSSVLPVRHARYGDPGAPREPSLIEVGRGRTIVELPLLTSRALGRNWPVAGGGYLRLLPVSVITRAIWAMNAEGEPAVVYMHPWEIDPDQPRIPGRRLNRWRHYVNLDRTEDKLRHLLDHHAFTTMSAHLGLEQQTLGEPAPIKSLATQQPSRAAG